MLDNLLQQIHSEASKFGAVGDSFSMTWRATLQAPNGSGSPPDIGYISNQVQNLIINNTGLNVTGVGVSVQQDPVDNLGSYTGGVYQADIYINDELSADNLAAQGQKDFNYIVNALSSVFGVGNLQLINSSSVATVAPQPINTNTGGTNQNTGGVILQPQPSNNPATKPPVKPSSQNWFDKNFFDGAGTMTAAGVSILIIIGAIIITQKNQ